MEPHVKRFLFSILIALGLHFVFLFLLSISFKNINKVEELKPLTVEVSLEETQYNKKEVNNKKQQAKTKPEKAFKEDDSRLDNTKTNTPSNTVDSNTVQLDADNSEKSKEQTWKPAKEKNSYTAEEPDDSFIDSIKSNSKNKDIDAKRLFGDDPIPPTLEKGLQGGSSKSAIVSSEKQIERETQNTGVKDTQEARTILGKEELEELSNKLSSGGGGANTENELAKDKSVKGGESPGTSLTFDDPASRRKLLSSPQPIIPEEIKTSGRPRYVVVLDFLIDADGFVSNINFRKNSTDPRVDAAVNEALRAWLFEEAPNKSSKKVKATLTYIIEIK